MYCITSTRELVMQYIQRCGGSGLVHEIRSFPGGPAAGIIRPQQFKIVSYPMRAKRGLYSGSRNFVWLLGVYLACVSSATQATSPGGTASKVVGSLKMIMQGLQTLRFSWSVLSYRRSKFNSKNGKKFRE